MRRWKKYLQGKGVKLDKDYPYLPFYEDGVTFEGRYTGLKNDGFLVVSYYVELTSMYFINKYGNVIPVDDFDDPDNEYRFNGLKERLTFSDLSYIDLVTSIRVYNDDPNYIYLYKIDEETGDDLLIGVVRSEYDYNRLRDVNLITKYDRIKEKRYLTI